MASENGSAMKRPKRQAAIAATIPISRIFKEDEDSSKSRMLKKLKSTNGVVYDVSSPVAPSTSKAAPKLGRCFLCGTSAQQCVFVSNIGECMTRVTRTKMLDALVQIAATDADAMDSLRGSDLELELICVSCENLLHEIDTLEVKCRLMKDSVVGMILRKSGKKKGKNADELVVPEANFFNISIPDQGVFLEGMDAVKKLEKMPASPEHDFEEETKSAFDGSSLAEQCMNLLTKFEELDVANQSPKREVKAENLEDCSESRPGKVPDFSPKLEHPEPVTECAIEVQEVASTSKRVSLKTWSGRRSQMKNIDKPVDEDELCPEGVERAPELICCVCGRYFETMKDRLSHERAHNEPPPHRCPFCKEVRNCRKELKEHVKDVHLQEKPMICTHCGDTFVDKRKMRFHLDSLNANADRPFVCTWPGCHEAFTVQEDLDSHVAGHSTSGGKIYECKECGKKYRQIRSLKQHSLSHSAFACKACPEVFMDKKAFIQHVMDVHSGDERRAMTTPPVSTKNTASTAPLPQTQIIATVVSVSSDPRTPLKTKIRVNGSPQIVGSTAAKVAKTESSQPTPVNAGSQAKRKAPTVTSSGHYLCPDCGLISLNAVAFGDHYLTCSGHRVIEREPVATKNISGKKKRRMNKTGWPTTPRPSSSSSTVSSSTTTRDDHAYPAGANYPSAPTTSYLAARLQAINPGDPYAFE